MIHRLRMLLSAVLIAAVCGGCSGGGSNDATYRFHSATAMGTLIPAPDRKPARDFTGNLIGGGTISLSDQAGKVVVVNFWASWCPPCLAEAPQLDALYHADKARGVTVIGIDTKDYSPDAPRAFIREHHISYPNVRDEPGKTAIALGRIPTAALPFSVLIDKQQRVAAVYLHPVTAADLRPVLDRLLAH